MNKHLKFALLGAAAGGAYNLTLNSGGTNKFPVFWGAVAVAVALSFAV